MATLFNYNSPIAIREYQNFLRQVTHRYRDAPSIAAWVIGNEFAYYGTTRELAQRL